MLGRIFKRGPYNRGETLGFGTLHANILSKFCKKFRIDFKSIDRIHNSDLQKRVLTTGVKHLVLGHFTETDYVISTKI